MSSIPVLVDPVLVEPVNVDHDQIVQDPDSGGKGFKKKIAPVLKFELSPFSKRVTPIV
jgi:hypothetical protein